MFNLSRHLAIQELPKHRHLVLGQPLKSHGTLISLGGARIWPSFSPFALFHGNYRFRCLISDSLFPHYYPHQYFVVLGFSCGDSSCYTDVVHLMNHLCSCLCHLSAVTLVFFGMISSFLRVQSLQIGSSFSLITLLLRSQSSYCTGRDLLHKRRRILSLILRLPYSYLLAF